MTASPTPRPTPLSRARRAVRRLDRRPAPDRVAPLAVGTSFVASSARRPHRRTYVAAAASGVMMMGPGLTAGHHRPAADAPPSAMARLEASGGLGADLPPLPILPALGSEEATEDHAEDGPIPLAVVDGVELVVPDGEPVVVGFHEAGGPSPRAMTPTTQLDEHHHPDHVEPTEDAHEVGHDAMVLPSRGRGTHAASAVDIALAPGSPVVAPVTGEVLLVAQYVLYGEHLDWIVRIRPDADPSKVVELVHVTEPTVHAGDHVHAGESPIAQGVRPLPFASQIDAFAAERVGGAVPHIHMEVEDL